MWCHVICKAYIDRGLISEYINNTISTTKRHFNFKIVKKKLERCFSKEDIDINSKYTKICSTSLIVVVQSPSHVQLCYPMNYRMPGFPVLRYLPEFAQTHVHWVTGVIQPSHSLSLPSPLALSFSQQQSLFEWIGSSHQVAKILELQFQYQSFQWIFKVDFL